MITRQEFVKKYSPFALSITKGTGIFPETLLSQMIIESQANVNGSFVPGASILAAKYNNFFGIKADRSWKGKFVSLKTGEEFVPGHPVIITDAFRVYETPEDSMRDYVAFLKGNSRYATAGVFTAPTVKDQAERLKQAGYATGSGYSDLIANVAKSIEAWIAPGMGGALGAFLIFGTFFF
jgi:flagellum-specific peptidoglycan hydrolase FlgJ